MGTTQSMPQQAQSFPSCVAMSVVFGILGVLNIVQLVRTRFTLYMEMSLTGFLPCISYAIAAATIARGSANACEAISYFFLSGSGYSVAIAVACLMMGVWYKNARDEVKPPKPHLWQKGAVALFTICMILGPVIGIPTVIYGYVIATPDALKLSMKLRNVNTISMLVIACIVTIAAFGSWLNVLYLDWRKRTLKAKLARQQQQQQQQQQQHEKDSIQRESSGGDGSISKLSDEVEVKDQGMDPDSMVWVLGVASILLVWSGAFRIVLTFQNPALRFQEHIVFTVQMLPLALNVLLWGCGPLLAKAALGGRYDAWFAEKQSRGKKEGGAKDGSRSESNESSSKQLDKGLAELCLEVSGDCELADLKGCSQVSSAQRSSTPGSLQSSTAVSVIVKV